MKNASFSSQEAMFRSSFSAELVHFYHWLHPHRFIFVPSRILFISGAIVNAIVYLKSEEIAEY